MRAGASSAEADEIVDRLMPRLYEGITTEEIYRQVRAMLDARGAARLLEMVGKMLPEIKLDPAPLFKEAELIETEMKGAMESVKQPRKPGEESYLYG